MILYYSLNAGISYHRKKVKTMIDATKCLLSLAYVHTADWKIRWFVK